MLLVRNTTLYSVDVITQGRSDHCIIMARLIYEGPTRQINANKKFCEIYIAVLMLKNSCEINM